jgi:hypothetical protein
MKPLRPTPTTFPATLGLVVFATILSACETTIENFHKKDFFQHNDFCERSDLGYSDALALFALADQAENPVKKYRRRCAFLILSKRDQESARSSEGLSAPSSELQDVLQTLCVEEMDSSACNKIAYYHKNSDWFSNELIDAAAAKLKEELNDRPRYTKWFDVYGGIVFGCGEPSRKYIKDYLRRDSLEILKTIQSNSSKEEVAAALKYLTISSPGSLPTLRKALLDEAAKEGPDYYYKKHLEALGELWTRDDARQIFRDCKRRVWPNCIRPIQRCFRTRDPDYCEDNIDRIAPRCPAQKFFDVCGISGTDATFGEDDWLSVMAYRISD